ncbi:MAG: rRNA pseudouridine synthase [Bacilli bacterium]|nr:rRNA pseudouridine synthase [Bacilli bacterium]
MLVRLQKIIADRGYCSRRRAEELILEGKVFVDDKLENTLGNKFEEDKVIIKIEDTILKPVVNKSFHYIMLNKPIGYICSLKDDRGRKTVNMLLPKELGRLFPVGRLDINSSGLLLMTDDGEFSNLVMHPSSSLDKTYKVEIDGQLTMEDKKHLEQGIVLEDGITAPCKVNIISIEIGKTTFEITIHEGRNRQIRRMVEAIGHKTISLTRLRIGPIVMSNLHRGEFKEVPSNLVDEIKQTCKYNKEHNNYVKK